MLSTLEMACDRPSPDVPQPASYRPRPSDDPPPSASVCTLEMPHSATAHHLRPAAHNTSLSRSAEARPSGAPVHLTGAAPLAQPTLRAAPPVSLTDALGARWRPRLGRGGVASGGPLERFATGAPLVCPGSVQAMSLRDRRAPPDQPSENAQSQSPTSAFCSGGAGGRISGGPRVRTGLRSERGGRAAKTGEQGGARGGWGVGRRTDRASFCGDRRGRG